MLSQRRVRRRAQGLWRSEQRNIWERERTPTPSSSLLFSSWASPSFSFASPWLPSVIGPHPRLFLSSSVSVPLFGWLNNLEVKFGAASEFGFQPLELKIKADSKMGPNFWRLMPLSVLCLKILRLCWQQYVCSLSQAGYFSCSQLQPSVQREWTYEIVKYGRRTSCFVFSSFCIIVIVDMQQWRWRVSKCGGGCFSHSTRCSWLSRLPHNYNNNLAEPPTLPLK